MHKMDLGYESEISVLSEYADSIKIGVKSEASKGAAYNADLVAEVTNIKNDIENSGNKIIVLKVEGDTSAGESLTFTIP